MQEWRLLEVDAPDSAAMNLAVDEAIFVVMAKRAVPPTLRLWRNNGAVVIGRYQNVAAEVNLDLCRERGIQVVRRFSGGGAVYHDLGNLNYSIAIKADHPMLKGLSIAETFEVFSSGVARGLEQLGLNAVFDPPSDLLLGNKKVSGNAQSRRKGVIFHHGTVLVHSDLDLLVKVLEAPKQNAEAEGKGVPSRKRPVVNLEEALGRKVGIAEVKGALRCGFEEVFAVKLVSGVLSPDERKNAERLCREKYSRNEWNLWR